MTWIAKSGVCIEEGMLLPEGPEFVSRLPNYVKIILYAFGLGYIFMGIAIVSDIFMSSIEAITAKKIRVFDKKLNRHRTFKIWNDTVSNLTLMALGSSAPEIMLNVIEIFKRDFHSAELGPGTIVGSAAFNLLIITAVCVMAIPSPEVRYIKEIPVYAVTATFSLLAYMWLIFILRYTSPDVVTVPEAAITFLFFPTVVVIAFAADKGYLGGTARAEVDVEALTTEELAEVVSGVRRQYGDVDDDMLKVLIERHCTSCKNKAQHRQRLAQRLRTSKSSGSRSTLTVGGSCSDGSTPLAAILQSKRTLAFETETTIGFAQAYYAVYENCGDCVVEVTRKEVDDKYDSRISVKYYTNSGSATPGKHYRHQENRLTFEPGIQKLDILIGIIDDDHLEPNRDFKVRLHDPHFEDENPKDGRNCVQLGIAEAAITIIDDDNPGVLRFECDNKVIEEEETDSEFLVKVVRRRGKRGRISCKYRTESVSAVSPLDFEAVEGELVLEDEETCFDIAILIKARGRLGRKDQLRLVLSDPTGCSFDKETDGGEEEDICLIEIVGNRGYKDRIEKLSCSFKEVADKMGLGIDVWKDQFMSAIIIGGSLEEQREAGLIDWFFHILTLPWKITLAIIPPPELLGGWPCFVFSLLFIGIITTLVSDLAPIMGCALGIPDTITAITIVALGTSLPDTFASKSAAVHDPYADASIGNVTGSNSVNVFLGLGMPWLFAAVYWEWKGATPNWQARYPSIANRYPSGGFVVEAGTLGFSVIMFTACAFGCIFCLFVRRLLFKGELGGPLFVKITTSIYLVLLWFGYVAASWIQIEI